MRTRTAKKEGKPTKKRTTDDPVRLFLASATAARLEADRHARRVAALDSRCARVTASLHAGPGGGQADAEALWAALCDARTEAAQAVRAEMDRYRAVENFIARLQDPTHRSILALRYLEGLNWIQVQHRLAEHGSVYSERHVTRLHGQALQAARLIWRDTEKPDPNIQEPDQTDTPDAPDETERRIGGVDF